MEDKTIIAIISLLSLIVSVVFVGLIWLIKKQFEQSNTTVKDANAANTALAASINNLTMTTQRQADAQEANDRANHEFQKKVMKSFDKQGKNLDRLVETQDKIIETQDRNYRAVLNQKVAVQQVDTQIIAKEV